MWGIKLNRQSELPLWRQIYQSLRDQTINGQLKAGEALISTRQLAKELAVSRNTVCLAYEMLAAEGFVINRQGAPTRIAEGLRVEKLPGSAPDEETLQPVYTFAADFRTGRPDLKQFPRFLWQQMLHKASGEMPLEQYDYAGPQGLLELRKEIAAWLFRSRGLTADPLDIFITAGATHALYLIADLLCEERQKVLMEDPCHTGMLRTFQNKGCLIVPVSVDEQGLQTECLTGKESACAVYVTPSHQFPLGGILPASRRASLIRFARESGAYIVEDDYDSEFRYCGEPVAPLQSMDPQRVIYVGTFSKTLFPGLRIGFTILPRQLQEPWRVLRTHADVQNPPFEQAALSELLRTRKFDRHVQKMRRIYGERRQALLDSLTQTFSGGWRVYGDAAGLHLAVEFPGMRFDDTYRKNCLQSGIFITSVEYHCIQKERHLDKLLIGYGHLEPEEIRNGIGLLHDFMMKV